MQFDPGMEYRPDWGEGKTVDNRLLRPNAPRPLHPGVGGMRPPPGGILPPRVGGVGVGGVARPGAATLPRSSGGKKAEAS